MNAIVLGKTAGLTSQSLWEIQLLGLSHIFSPSGFHANCLFVLLYKNRWLNRKSPILESAIWILIFIFLWRLGEAASWPKPYVRASIMGAAAFALKKGGIKISDETLLAIAAIFAFWFGKGGDLSWLLSCAGMLGLIAAKNKWQGLVFPWLCTLPISTFCFGTISYFSPISNLLLAPLISVSILPIGLASLFAPRPIANILLEKGEQLSEYWARLANLLFNFSYSSWVNFEHFGFVICLAICLKSIKEKNKYLTLAMSGILFLLWLNLLQPKRGAWILDVGQGDAILLSGKTNLLIDTGADGIFPPIQNALRKMGGEKIHHVLLTHPDQDHSGGLAEVLLKFSSNDIKIWLNPNWLPLPAAERIIFAAFIFRVPIHFLGNSTNKTTKIDELNCQIIPNKFFTKTNEYSPLCKWILPSGKGLLLTGDMSESGEKYWLKYSQFSLNSFYLKVAHHGSATSSNLDFLKAVAATDAIISVGKNRYGHPTDSAMERIWSSGSKIRSTLNEGSIFLN